MYNYEGKVLSVYDADTCEILFDLGFNISIKEKVRLMGINCPELRTKDLEEKKAGYEARDFVRGLILGQTFKVTTHKPGKFGRMLVDIHLTDTETLTSLLIKKGMGRKYHGKKKLPWKEWKDAGSE